MQWDNPPHRAGDIDYGLNEPPYGLRPNVSENEKDEG